MSKVPSPAEAAALVMARAMPLAAQFVALAECAGRTLRQDVHAERDNPPFDRVCMDGVALTSAALASGTRRFHLQATQAAGEIPLRLSAPDAAIEAMTGAVLPHGTDCVVPLEEYDLAAGVLTLKGEVPAEPWRNVQRRGSDSRPGVPMLTSGMRLGAAEVAVVASAGLAQVQVSREPRVMVVSTGDELIDPGHPIAAHQIRRSNAYCVAASLRLHGYRLVDDTHLRDEEALMRRRLGEVLEDHDVVVLSGGVSKGKFDFVPKALQALGVTEVFHEVAQRPGRPMFFGVGPRGQLLFGLPGNPVSTLVCLVRYVLPALQALQQSRPEIRERMAIAEESGGRKLTYFMPVTRRDAAAGPRALVTTQPPNGSGDFLALAGTDGFIELPPRPEGYPAGFEADFYRW